MRKKRIQELTVTEFLKAEQIPNQGAKSLASRYYTSDAIFRAENERIFGQRWLVACREEEVPQPGDFVLHEVAGESVIVVRGGDGAIRAFYNLCRHRGARLCEKESGNLGGAIQCPYHGWSYALDGRLLGAPHMSGLMGFRKSDYPLHAVKTASWEGYVLISLAADPEPFAAAWTPLIGRFSRFGIATLRAARRIEYDVRANWKLIFENYSECYHCSLVHPDLVRLTPATGGANDLTAGPFLGGYMEIQHSGGSLTMSGRACGLPVGDLAAEDLQRVYYYSIFPNMLLSLHPDYVMVHRVWPLAADRTRILCEWLFHPASFTDPACNADDAVDFWDRTNKQDWRVCELCQKGVSSRAHTPGPYSPKEGLAARWDQEYLQIMGE